MKKLFQIFTVLVTASFIFSACSGPKYTAGGADVSRSKFTGDWTISNVTYEGLVEGAVQTVFDQAPPRSFVGSTWKLTNSGNGIYTLPSGTSQTIYWSVNNNDSRGQLLQFKKIYQGDKAKNVSTGYQLLVAGNDGSSMTLKTPVAYGNTTGYIVYSFNKAK